MVKKVTTTDKKSNLRQRFICDFDCDCTEKCKIIFDGELESNHHYTIQCSICKKSFGVKIPFYIRSQKQRIQYIVGKLDKGDYEKVQN